MCMHSRALAREGPGFVYFMEPKNTQAFAEYVSTERRLCAIYRTCKISHNWVLKNAQSVPIDRY